MNAVEAHVLTPRASRYLTQLAQHVEHLRDRPHTHLGRKKDGPAVTSAEWTDTDATLTFTWGRCTLHASLDSLTLRLDATEQDHLLRLQSLITHRLEAISRRDHLTITWQPTVTALG